MITPELSTNNSTTMLYSERVEVGCVDAYDEVQRLKNAKKNKRNNNKLKKRGKSKSMVVLPGSSGGDVSSLLSPSLAEKIKSSKGTGTTKSKLTARGKAMSMIMPATTSSSLMPIHYDDNDDDERQNRSALQGLVLRHVVQEDAKAKWTAATERAIAPGLSSESTTVAKQQQEEVGAVTSLLESLSPSIANYKRPPATATGSALKQAVAKEERHKRLAAMRREHDEQQGQQQQQQQQQQQLVKDDGNNGTEAEKAVAEAPSSSTATQVMFGGKNIEGQASLQGNPNIVSSRRASSCSTATKLLGNRPLGLHLQEETSSQGNTFVSSRRASCSDLLGRTADVSNATSLLSAMPSFANYKKTTTTAAAAAASSPTTGNDGGGTAGLPVVEVKPSSTTAKPLGNRPLGLHLEPPAKSTNSKETPSLTNTTTAGIRPLGLHLQEPPAATSTKSKEKPSLLTTSQSCSALGSSNNMAARTVAGAMPSLANYVFSKKDQPPTAALTAAMLIPTPARSSAAIRLGSDVTVSKASSLLANNVPSLANYKKSGIIDDTGEEPIMSQSVGGERRRRFSGCPQSAFVPATTTTRRGSTGFITTIPSSSAGLGGSSGGGGGAAAMKEVDDHARMCQSDRGVGSTRRGRNAFLPTSLTMAADSLGPGSRSRSRSRCRSRSRTRNGRSMSRTSCRSPTDEEESKKDHDDSRVMSQSSSNRGVSQSRRGSTGIVPRLDPCPNDRPSKRTGPIILQVKPGDVPSKRTGPVILQVTKPADRETIVPQQSSSGDDSTRIRADKAAAKAEDPLSSSSNHNRVQRRRPKRTKRDSLSLSDHSGTSDRRRDRRTRTPRSPLSSVSEHMFDIEEEDPSSDSESVASIYDVFDFSMSELDVESNTPKQQNSVKKGESPQDSLGEIDLRASLQRSMSDLDLKRASLQESMSELDLKRASLQRSISGIDRQRASLQQSISETYEVFDFSLSSIDPAILEEECKAKRKILSHRRNTIGNLSVAHLAAARARTRRARVEANKNDEINKVTPTSAGGTEAEAASKIHDKNKPTAEKAREQTSTGRTMRPNRRSCLSQRRASFDTTKRLSRRTSALRRHSTADQGTSAQAKFFGAGAPKNKAQESFSVANSELIRDWQQSTTTTTASSLCPTGKGNLKTSGGRKSPDSVVAYDQHAASQQGVQFGATMLSGLKKKLFSASPTSYDALNDSMSLNNSMSELEIVRNAIKQKNGSLDKKISQREINGAGKPARRPSELEIVSQAIKSGDLSRRVHRGTVYCNTAA